MPANEAIFIAFGLHKFSENLIFTDADDYSIEIELPLADWPQNLDIFGIITRKDVDTGDIFFDAMLKKWNPSSQKNRLEGLRLEAWSCWDFRTVL